MDATSDLRIQGDDNYLPSGHAWCAELVDDMSVHWLHHSGATHCCFFLLKLLLLFSRSCWHFIDLSVVLFTLTWFELWRGLYHLLSSIVRVVVLVVMVVVGVALFSLLGSHFEHLSLLLVGLFCCYRPCCVSTSGQILNIYCDLFVAGCAKLTTTTHTHTHSVFGGGGGLIGNSPDCIVFLLLFWCHGCYLASRALFGLQCSCSCFYVVLLLCFACLCFCEVVLLLLRLWLLDSSLSIRFVFLA